jgi:hypothetical protein
VRIDVLARALAAEDRRAAQRAVQAAEEDRDQPPAP